MCRGLPGRGDRDELKKVMDGGTLVVDSQSTSPDVRRSGVATAIVPLGSIEQHGEALPLDTDLVIASGIASRVAREMSAYLLPAVPFGTCQEHKGGNGSAWVQPATYMAYLQDLCISLSEGGFARIAFILGHGGLWAAKPAFRQLNMSDDRIAVVHVCPADAFAPDIARIIETPPSDDVHAGEYEASVMLYLSPDSVHLDRAQDYVPREPRSLLDCVPLLAISPTGVWGMPSRGTREKGEKLMELLVSRTIAHISGAFLDIDRLKTGRAHR